MYLNFIWSDLPLLLRGEICVPKQLAVDYSQHIKYLKRILPQKDIQNRLTNQRQHFLHFYDWDQRIKEWIAFLNNALMKKGIPHED